MSRYGVVIIGGGAGLSAALVLSRSRRRVLVVDAGTPRNAPTTHMHGCLSRDRIPPAELLAAGRHEVTGYGGEIVEGTVTELVPNGPSGFWALLGGGRLISARRLLVTTGMRDELPDIPGLRDRWARDVLHCPYCHRHEVRDRRLHRRRRGQHRAAGHRRCRPAARCAAARRLRHPARRAVRAAPVRPQRQPPRRPRRRHR